MRSVGRAPSSAGLWAAPAGQNLVAQGSLAKYSSLVASALGPLIQPFLARTVRRKGGERKRGRQRKGSVTGPRQSQTRATEVLPSSGLRVWQTLGHRSVPTAPLRRETWQAGGPAMLLCPVTTGTRPCSEPGGIQTRDRAFSGVLGRAHGKGERETGVASPLPHITGLAAPAASPGSLRPAEHGLALRPD